MNTTQMLDKIAELEFVNDQLEAEVSYVDHLLRSAGFTEGLYTLKDSVIELLDNEDSFSK